MTAEMTITVSHDGVTYSGQLMRVRSTSLTVEDHGIFTAFLHCEYPGGGIGVGGYALDGPHKTDAEPYGRRGSAYGCDQIMRLIETVGAESWEKVPGHDVVVLFAEGRSGWGGIAVGIAGVVNGKVLDLKRHAQSFLDEQDGAS